MTVKQKKKGLAVRLLLLTALLFLASVIPAEGESGEYLFFNDSLWAGVSYETIYDEYYIPASFFLSFSQVEMKSDPLLGTLLLDRGGSGSISFDFDSETGYTPSDGFFRCKTYLLRGGERFLPAPVTCASLGLTLEISPEDRAVRVSDTSARLSFADLIADPYGGKQDPPGPSTPVFPPDGKGTIPVCLVIDRPDPAFLPVLSSYGVKAVFLLPAADIGKEASFLSEICSLGHQVAFVPDAYDEAGIAEELEGCNALLCRLTKTRSRFLYIPGLSGTFEKRFYELYSSGYLLAPDGISSSAYYYSSDAMLSALLSNGGGVIRFSAGSAWLLDEVLSKTESGETRFSFSFLTPAVCLQGVLPH